MTRHLARLAALVSLLLGLAIQAAVPPAGPDTLLRTSDGIEGLADAAGNAQGGFALLTSRFLFPETRYQLRLQHYAANGTALGPPQRVSESATVQEDFGALAMNASGSSVAVWRSTESFTAFQVLARRYAAGGSAAGAAFEVARIADIEGVPAVAIGADGRFVVVWQSVYRVALTPGDQGAVLLLNYLWARPYHADGTPQGGARLVHVKGGFATGIDSPGVALDAQGNFTVAWYDIAPSRRQIMARRYLASGNARGLAYVAAEGVSAVAPGRTPIAMNPDGRHLLAWPAHNGLPYSDVYARRYPAQGAPVAAPLRLNSHTDNAQQEPALAMRAAGDWAAVWSSNNQDGDVDALNIYGQRYAADDTPVGGEFRANAHTAGVQYNPRVLMDAQGGLTVIWSGAGAGGDGFHMHRFAPP